ncbi:MAG: hypothetical protein ACLP19_18180 [Xanthobacteraceae bacterium]
MTENRRQHFKSVVGELLADVANWQSEIQRASALIADLRERGDIVTMPAYAPSATETPKPTKRKRRGRPAGHPKKVPVKRRRVAKPDAAKSGESDDAAEERRVRQRENMRKYRAKKAAAAVPISGQEPAPPPSEPPLGEWHTDEHGNRTRFHVAEPTPSPLIGREPTGQVRRRRGNSDAEHEA